MASQSQEIQQQTDSDEDSVAQTMSWNWEAMFSPQEPHTQLPKDSEVNGINPTRHGKGKSDGDRNKDRRMPNEQPERPNDTNIHKPPRRESKTI